jgi:hypothetical protein
MADSALLNNNFVIRNLLQQADELTRQPFGLNSTVTVVGEEQYSIPIVTNSSDSNALNIEEVDEVTANQILRSLSAANVNSQYQVIDGNSTASIGVDGSTSVFATTLNYAGGELFQDPNPPQIIRRPAAKGPITYRQNVSVRFLQPPPVPPPGVCFTFQNNFIYCSIMIF